MNDQDQRDLFGEKGIGRSWESKHILWLKHSIKRGIYLMTHVTKIFLQLVTSTWHVYLMVLTHWCYPLLSSEFYPWWLLSNGCRPVLTFAHWSLPWAPEQWRGWCTVSHRDNPPDLGPRALVVCCTGHGQGETAHHLAQHCSGPAVTWAGPDTAQWRHHGCSMDTGHCRHHHQSLETSMIAMSTRWRTISGFFGVERIRHTSVDVAVSFCTLVCW